MTTTLIYVHLMDSPVRRLPCIEALEGVSAEEWAAAQEEFGHYLKTIKSLFLSKAADHKDDHPADYCVLTEAEILNECRI